MIRPTPTSRNHLEQYRRLVSLGHRGHEYPITDAALEHLVPRRATIATASPTLVWGEHGVGNMIFGGDRRLAAVIDWELASIGPPEIDVGHWLFFDRFATDAVGVEPLPGWPDRAETIARYEERSGRALGDLEWFEMLEELVIATTLIRQADARVARGSPPLTRVWATTTR